MKKYTFEMYHEVTEQTTVKAESQQQAEAVIQSGYCKWVVDSTSDGGDFYLVDEEEVSNEQIYICNKLLLLLYLAYS